MRLGSAQAEWHLTGTKGMGAHRLANGHSSICSCSNSVCQSNQRNPALTCRFVTQQEELVALRDENMRLAQHIDQSA